MQYKGSNDKTAYDRYGSYILFAVIAVAIYLIYGRILDAQFVFDDELHIGKNENIGNLASYLWPPSRTRYITELTFALNYYFWGLNLFAFHVVNVIFHVFNAALVFLLIRETFNTPVMSVYKEDVRGRNRVFYIAAVSALIFAVHPVQTGAVTYVVQRATVFAGFFYMLSVYLYSRWRRAAVTEGRMRLGPVYVIAVLFTFAAQLTKEICVTLPAMIALYDVAFFNDRKGIKARAYLAPFLSIFIVIPVAVIYRAIAYKSGILQTLNTMVSAETTPYLYLINQFRVMLTYLRLIILPINQTVDYDYQPAGSLVEPRIIGSLIVLLIIAAITAYVYVNARKKRDHLLMLAAAGVVWFAVVISIESSVIPIRDYIFEHRLYLPLAGATLVFSTVVFRLTDYLSAMKDRAGTVAAAICVAIVVPLGIAAYARNAIWTSPIAFWSDAVRKSPMKARDHDNLGSSFKMAGYLNEALSEYEIAVRLDPKLPTARKNLGSTYYMKERFSEAAREFEMLIELQPGRPDAYTNLADAYHGLGMTNEAIAGYKESLRLSPNGTVNHYNLGVVYEQTGDIDSAISHYRTFVDKAPEKYRMEKQTVIGIIESLEAKRAQKKPGRARKAGK